MKQIIIINGVMGQIGSALFTHFAGKQDYIVYGISRKGLYFDKYVGDNGLLPETHLVFSIAEYLSENFQIDIDNFIDSLPHLPIVFIHTIGEFVTEINAQGNVEILNDYDGDGINDNVKRLTYDIPILFAKKLSERKKRTVFIQLGSQSDKYRLEIHGSWIRSMDLVKSDLRSIASDNKNFHALVLNISSVLTPKELVDRPFVLLNTDANLSYWLSPTDVVLFINEYIISPTNGMLEEDLYKKWPDISTNHFTLEAYKDRRNRELFDNLRIEYKDVLQLSNGEDISYNFNNPFHMDRLWGNLTTLFSRQHDKLEPIYFYNPHNWFFIVRNKSEHEIFSSIEEADKRIFLTCGNDTRLDREVLEREFKYHRHKYVIDTSLNLENNYNLNIYGDFVIEVLIDKITAEKIDAFYKKYQQITKQNTLELKEIVSRSGRNVLTVYRDKDKAGSLVKLLAKNFSVE